jgi:hypothetical protein
LSVRRPNRRPVQESAEPIYGGYANRRGEISLFAAGIVYRVNFKNNTIAQRPPLNAGAQACYDATEAGETFEYANVTFQRLSSAQIAEICSSGWFRVTLNSCRPPLQRDELVANDRQG